ncbi:type II secretion system protein [Metaclostridioides mangenotii]|uniref:Type IV pilus assembly protein PilA n=1 Tax=Metaclostridioides mangenotii TaxID=1540 RepID=A0ABS4EAI4_9FIRM|nr:type II secretion system protein [Clostridioides mangenotii]MBP1854952.1 type IV pilus assembly protein PilA [Clostridioides mangenotii]
MGIKIKNKKLFRLKDRKKKGFTLVEMVIVITILGILSSIALVKYGKVQDNAKLNADYTNAANIATATSIAISDDKSIAENISVETLKEKGYLNTVPVPQSKVGSFTIKVLYGGDDIAVFVDTEQFYPK